MGGGSARRPHERHGRACPAIQTRRHAEAARGGRRCELGEVGDQPFEAVSAAAPPDAALDAAERQVRLETALRELPPHQRVPIVLFHFEHLGYEDIARTLGVSVGKVKTDMHRGRLALRRVLA